jgi:3D (Asp-Asp-Asp) domain-containing protein
MTRQTATAVLAGLALGAAVGLGAGWAVADRPVDSPASAAAASQPAASEAPSSEVQTAPPALVTALPRPAPEAEKLAPGKRMGRFQLTYYWMASETPGPRQVQLYDKRCRKVARVSRAFERQLRMEGGGKLRDGRVLTYSGRCDCPHSPCYRDARRGHSWGTGVRERPLSPFRSVAVDPRHVSIGEVLYIPELDGMTMPGSHPWGGFVHDGCVVADDQGGGVRGRQLDLFAARKGHYRALSRRLRGKKVTVFDGGERCQSLTRRPRPGSS